MAMLLTAFMMGLAGSFHCFGMCSPLIVASTRGKGQAFTRRIYYNGGRIFVYAIQGAVVSSIGLVFEFAGIQQWVSVVLGAGLILMGILGITSFRMPLISNGLHRFTSWLKIKFTKFLSVRTMKSTIVLGSLNGILPCGLTYIALAYCVTLATPADGFIFMTFFGMGTLPVMLGAAGGMQWIINRLKITTRTITTMTVIVIGSMLVARGIVVHAATKANQITVCK
jgi:sulfite exporter TauE/SafE